MAAAFSFLLKRAGNCNKNRLSLSASFLNFYSMVHTTVSELYPTTKQIRVSVLSLLTKFLPINGHQLIIKLHQW